jgi:YesN/AraC family two-component response regulator
MPLIQVIAEANNGQEVLQLLEANQPDVVLMDVKMPLMDGLEATQQIKLQWPQVKVVILTIYYKHQTEAKAAGADMFLLKGGPIERLWSSLLQVEAA